MGHFSTGLWIWREWHKELGMVQNSIWWLQRQHRGKQWHLKNHSSSSWGGPGPCWTAHRPGAPEAARPADVSAQWRGSVGSSHTQMITATVLITYPPQLCLLLFPSGLRATYCPSNKCPFCLHSRRKVRNLESKQKGPSDPHTDKMTIQLYLIFYTL